MHDSDHFVVIVSEKRFVLSRAQLEYDAPNYFTRRFLDRGVVDPLELSRDPQLFRIIADYLCGYSGFLRDTPKICLPSTRTLADLLCDATFYELRSLEAICEHWLANPTKLRQNGETNNHVVVTWTTRADKYRGFDKVAILRSNHNKDDLLYIDADVIPRLKLSDFKSPESCSGLNEFMQLKAAQQRAESVPQAFGTQWKVVGWSITGQYDGSFIPREPGASYSYYQVVLILEV